MTPLRQRMINDMTVRGLASTTIASYLRSVMRLDANEFIRRFLLHVLPRGFTRLRHYGLLANRCRARKLALCRELLHQPTPEPREPETTRELLLRLTGTDITVCGQCGKGTLRQILILEPPHRMVMKTGPP